MQATAALGPNESSYGREGVCLVFLVYLLWYTVYCALGDTKELASYSVVALLMPVSSKNYFSQIPSSLPVTDQHGVHAGEGPAQREHLWYVNYYSTGTSTNTACRISLPETRISHWMKKVLHRIKLYID